VENGKWKMENELGAGSIETQLVTPSEMFSVEKNF
jgi:hypothetical protein